MSLLFDRSVAISFGKPKEVGVLFRDLFIKFKIVMSSEPKPNTGEILIYNLNQTTRSILQKEKKGLVVRLETGYKNILEELYFGDISNVFVSKEGPDIITKLVTGSGRRAYQGGKINQSFAAGTTTKTVVEALVLALDVGIGAIKGVTDESFQHGLTISGPIKDKLNEITKKMGLEWSIQNNSLQILPPDVPSEILGLVINERTGMIGKPVEREQDEKLKGKTIEFQSLIRTKLQPGVAVKIESKDIDGFFKIRKSTFEGDSRTGPFMVTCECSEINTANNVPNQKLNI